MGQFLIMPYIAAVLPVFKVVPATFLGVGLAGVEIKDHIKTCFFWIWGVSLVCMAAGLVLGVISL